MATRNSPAAPKGAAKPRTPGSGVASAPSPVASAPVTQAPATSQGVQTSTALQPTSNGPAGDQAINATVKQPVESRATYESLYGSTILPAWVTVGGTPVQLGTIVAAAHAKSGLTVADWNALTEADRELHLQAQITWMEEVAAAAEHAAASESEPDPVDEEGERAAAKKREQYVLIAEHLGHLPAQELRDTLALGGFQIAEAERLEAEAELHRREREPRPAWPCNAFLRHNGNLSTITEPVTGTVLAPISSASVVIRDEEHAEEVLKSLAELQATNFMSLGTLVLDGLPT